MGRALKNTVLKSGSYAIAVPTGTNTIAPEDPINGQLRYNSSIPTLQYYQEGEWLAFAHEGSAVIVRNAFAGDNITSIFGPMDYSYDPGQEAQVLVFVNSVFQDPGVNYLFNGTANITFTSTPPLGASIVILHNISSTVAG